MNAIFQFMRQLFPRNAKSDFETMNIFSSTSQVNSKEMDKQTFIKPDTKALTYYEKDKPEENIELEIIAQSLIEPS